MGQGRPGFHMMVVLHRYDAPKDGNADHKIWKRYQDETGQACKGYLKEGAATLSAPSQYLIEKDNEFHRFYTAVSHKKILYGRSPCFCFFLSKNRISPFILQLFLLTYEVSYPLQTILFLLQKSLPNKK